MKNYRDILEGLGNKNSAARRMGNAQKATWKKKQEKEYLTKSKNREKELGKMKAKVDFEFWLFALKTLKDRQLADHLNDVLKTSNNIDGKLRVVDYDDKKDEYLIRMKKMDVSVPAKFVKLTKGKKIK